MASRKQIVIATFGSLGDIHPAMAIALGLQAIGHHVVIATSEAYRTTIEHARANARKFILST